MAWRRIASFGLLAFICAADGTAQIVQLPTFSQFSIGTTVVVPDGGAAYLGGVTRSRYSSSSYGVPLLHAVPGLGRLTGARARSFEMSSSHAYATATIHDMSALDRAVLAAADRRHPALITDPETREKALFLAKHIGRRTPERSADPLRSVWDIRAAQRMSALSLRNAPRKSHR